jgi:hypothetical protein
MEGAANVLSRNRRPIHGCRQRLAHLGPLCGAAWVSQGAFDQSACSRLSVPRDINKRGAPNSPNEDWRPFFTLHEEHATSFLCLRGMFVAFDSKQRT